MQLVFFEWDQILETHKVMIFLLNLRGPYF